MSSNRPPHLRLSLQGENGTSFKRSFEQYGFDLDTPFSSVGRGGGGEAGGSSSSGIGSGSGNERNKRARSQTSLSNSDETGGSSASSVVEGLEATESSGMNIEEDSLSDLSATRPHSLVDNVSNPLSVLAPFSGPPRLPSPGLQDIEMSALDEAQSAPTPSTSSLSPTEGYRISLERFNAFDSEISALRHTPSRSRSRSSTPSPPLSQPTVSAIHDSDNEANPRLHPHARSNIPGLQVFSLGELHEHETDSREASSRFQPAFDMHRVNPAILFPDQGSSRNNSRPSISTLDGMDGHSPTHNQLPSALPRLSSPALISPEDMQWWSPQLYDDTSSRSPPQLRAASPRATPNYTHDWFDTSSQTPQREHPRSNPLLDAHLTASDRSDAAVRSNEAMLRRMVAESSDGESSAVEFSSQAARERHRSIFQSLRRTAQPSGVNEGGHRHHQAPDQPLPLSFSRVDWSPYERSDGRSMTPRYQRSASGSRAGHLHTEDEDEDTDDWTPTATRAFRSPMTEPLDIDLNPSNIGRHSNTLGTQSRASPDMASSPISNNSSNSQRPSGYHTSTSNIFLRRPISPPSTANTFGGSGLRSSRLPSTAIPRRANSPNNAWPVPQSHLNDEPLRQPPGVQSRLHSTRVGASNYLASENAAELRRRLARSQMLRYLPISSASHEDLNDDPWSYPESLDISDGSPPRTDRTEGYWASPPVRAHRLHDAHSSQAIDPTWRNRYENPLLRDFGWTTRRSDDEEHGIHIFGSFSPPSDSQFGSGVVPGSYNRNLTGIINRERDVPQSSASSATSPTSSLPGRPFVNREVPLRGRAFPSSIDNSREISSTRLMRVQSPVAWEGNTHSTDYTTLPAGSPVLRSTDLETRAWPRGRFRRSSLVDANLFQSPSPSPSPPLVERVRPPLAETPRSIPSTAHGNFDLSAYHEGPFRASLQRFVDIRSRLNRLESMADGVSSDLPPSPSSHSPPFTPLNYRNDDHLSAAPFTSQHAANPAPQSASSTVVDPQPRYSHMIREGRVNRIPFSGTSASPSAHSHNHNASGNTIPRHVQGAAEALAVRVEPRYNSFQEAENRTQQDRLDAYDARMQAYWNQIQSGDSVDTTHDTHLTSSSIRSAEAELQNVRIQERNISRMASINARVRAIAQVRLGVGSPNVAGVSGFRRAVDIPTSNRLSTPSQRQISGRYQSDRSADSERSSMANNDGDSVGSRSSSTRVRYARRGRFYRPSQQSESSGTLISGGLSNPTRYNRSSSLSPTRGNNNSERSAATAPLLADRTARFRARAHRGRELMGEFPRPHLVNYTNHAGRNMGDYVRDEDFDSSYENLLSLASAVGEARPRATPNHIMAALPTGFYKDWQTADSDQRCPICLDDYKPLDPVLKLSDCLHWLHKSCLEQWLRNANTCPVCRKRVEGPRCPRNQHQRNPDQALTPSGSGGNRRYHEGDDDSAPDAFVSGTPPWRFWG